MKINKYIYVYIYKLRKETDEDDDCERTVYNEVENRQKEKKKMNICENTRCSKSKIKYTQE